MRSYDQPQMLRQQLETIYLRSQPISVQHGWRRPISCERQRADHRVWLISAVTKPSTAASR